MDIQLLKVGVDNCYIIRDENTILVDGGMPGRLEEFSIRLKNIGMNPNEIEALVITHCHWDHIGCARQIKDMTRANVIVQKCEKGILENGELSMPPGVTRWGEEQINRLVLEKKTLETHLRLLQAQIEPHFLFNTLSNVLSLLDFDPARGRAMLEDLTRYLRSSLSRTREQTTTLRQEMDLVEAYLRIQQVRMGDRLRYAIDIPKALQGLSLPPMLIQPLVENAIKHGIEPSIEGGDIVVRAEETPYGCRMVVADTGPGLVGASTAGVGLTNIRERLEALFHGKARLILEENQPCGLKATLEVPHE